MKKYFVKKDGSRWNVICKINGEEIVVEVKNSQAAALAIATKLRKGN